MRFPVLAIALLCAATPVAAQHGHVGHDEVKGSGRLPDGWNALIDGQPANTALERLNLMQMGANTLHVQMGMANAIFWNEKDNVKGEFELSATFRQTKQPAHHPEGYGLVFNGSRLDGPEQSYVYFLVKDGQYLINHRAGDEVHKVVPWTAHAAIAKPDASGKVTNDLAVRVVGKDVLYIVNGQVVHRHDRDYLQPDGIVGFRVNMHLDVVIENFRVTQGSAKRG